MHIVIVGDYPRDPAKISGGVEAVVLYLTQALECYPDLKISVITLGKRGAAERVMQHNRVMVHYLPRSDWPGRLSIMVNIRQMKERIMRLKPDLVHAHIAGEYAEAAAATGLPWVLTLHGIRFLEAALRQDFLNKTYRAWFIKREELRAIKRAEHIISISPFVQATFNGQIKGHIYNIENPIADAFFELPQGGNPGQLLFAGRLIPRKGVHTLLQAFANLHQQLPISTLRLAGGKDYRNESKTYYQELEQFVVNNGLTQAVTFLGELDEPALLAEYTNCSALVLSSVLETAPMVIMQALAAGKAVVSTDAGGARHLVDHGYTGLIVPPNDVSALSQALYQILSDETQLKVMGQRAQEVARRRFHARVVAAKTREVYYTILGKTLPRET